MNRYLVDLHIHTLLSPCGDLDMSPEVIVDWSLRAGLDAIAVCDHNTTLQAPVVREVGRRKGLTVFLGVELTTREEAHCVAIFPDEESLEQMQIWVDEHLMKIPNVPEKFGDQVWVDADDNIMGEVEWYLNSAIDKSVEEIAEKVNSLGGLFVPAHVDRQANSLIGQLGFISPMLTVAAVEYNHKDRLDALKTVHKYLNKHTCYTASDAHFPSQIGTNPSYMYAATRSFEELGKAFAGLDGRQIISRNEENTI